MAYDRIDITDAAAEQAGSGGRKKKDIIRRGFTAFLAGAMLAGSLTFAADRMNLFTGGIETAQVTGPSPAAEGAQAGTIALNKGSNSIPGVTEKAAPAVVKIETDGDGSIPPGEKDGSRTAGIGSGFIFEETGYILTNEHVVGGAAEINVTVQGRSDPFKAKLLGSSYDLDLAVLKIEDSTVFPALKLGSSDKAKIGDWVVAIGNPEDFDQTVTAGLLSAKNRAVGIEDERGSRNYTGLIQTDAAINPGNSGGPLLNLKGEVIGINTAVAAEAQGIGFAISTGTIHSVLEKLKNGGTIPRKAVPYLGVSIQDVTEDMLNALNLERAQGAFVADVQANSPAAKAGIRQNDVITALNGSAFADSKALSETIKTAKVGERLELTIYRDGKTKKINVTVGDQAARKDTAS